MCTHEYCRLFVVHLFLVGIVFNHTGAEAGNIEEGNIDLPQGKGGMKVEKFNFPLPSKQQADKTGIPLPGNNSNQTDGKINNAVPDTADNAKKTQQQTVAQSAATPVKSEENYAESTAAKFGGGLWDIVTSWLELPKTVVNTTKKDGLAAGLTVGFAKGIANTAEQAVSGAANVATFPVPKKVDIDMVENPGDEFNMEKTFGAAFKSNKAANGK